MNKLERTLYKSRKSFRQACREAGVDIEEADTPELAECTSCNIWLKHSELTPDLDENPICPACHRFYGM